MNDLDGYRRFIEQYASLGYALLFRKLGDFNQAQTALENALVAGHSSWLLERRLPREAVAFMTKLAAAQGTAGVAATPERPAGLLATSQKLRALDGAVDQLRSFPADDQVALVLLHVEEVPAEQILRWLDKSPDYLADLRTRLQEKALPWSPQGTAAEDPAAFFMRALRQNRLSAQFPDLVLQRLKTDFEAVRFPAPVFGWILLVASPLLLLPNLTQHYGYYDRDYESWDSQAIVGVQQMALDLFSALAALLLGRWIRLHAPAELAGPLAPGLSTILGLAGMSGFGLFACEALVLLKSGSLRPLTGSIWSPLHALWLFAAIAFVLLGLYRIGIHYSKKADARNAAGSGGAP